MRKFLASVGNAQLLGKVGGELQHIADVRTLTDSTLSFSNSVDEIRAGEGAQLYGRFSHDAGMTIQLTDAMFDMHYIALQIGADLDGNGAGTSFHMDENLSVTTGSVTLTQKPAKLGSACGLDKIVVWFRAPGCETDGQWIAKEYATAATTVAVPEELSSATKLCARYFISTPQAINYLVKANFVPAELVLILTTKLYSGDANAPETGKPVGEITVKIPRFQLDGQFDLSMAMSSPSTMSLSGTALAVSDGTCDGAGVYAEIIEVETGSIAFTGLKEIAIDSESTEELVTVYGMYADGHYGVLGEFTGSGTQSLGTTNGTSYNLVVTMDNDDCSAKVTQTIGATTTDVPGLEDFLNY